MQNVRTFALYHRRRFRLAALAAVVATVGAMVFVGAGIASASIAPVPAIPGGYTYQFENYEGGFLYLNPSTGKVEVWTGGYISISVTLGQSQEYVDVGTNNCLTYNVGHYIYEKGCGGESSQLWRSNELSDGYWNIKNNYLGTGDCLTYNGPSDNVIMTTCGGSQTIPQQWKPIIIG
jgi:hypothetical protein